MFTSESNNPLENDEIQTLEAILSYSGYFLISFKNT